MINYLFQVMYSFVMRPESLPKAYRDFIQKTGPVAEPVYKAVRDSCRGYPVDVAALSSYLSRRQITGYENLEELPSIIPCSIIHPNTKSCLAHNGKAASATFKKTFPLYFSLTFVPFVVLHLQKVSSPKKKLFSVIDYHSWSTKIVFLEWRRAHNRELVVSIYFFFFPSLGNFPLKP